MYTILITNNNELIATEKITITQFSNMVNDIRFLCSSTYFDEDMSSYDSVVLEYITPLTKTYRKEELLLSEERYKDYLQYFLPIDTKLSGECGFVDMQLTFKKKEIDEITGQIENKIRKTKLYKLKIEPVENWNNYVFDVSENVVINDNIIGTGTTYSSQKIEDNFIDNSELEIAFNENTEVVYNTVEPTDTNATTWYKIQE